MLRSFVLTSPPPRTLGLLGDFCYVPVMPAYFCPHCKITATFVSHGPNVGWNGRIHNVWGCNNCQGVVYAQTEAAGQLSEMYPHVRSDAPPELPDDVRENLAEGIRSLNVNNPKAAVIMIRSALQASMRDKGAMGANLRDEIDDLAAKHVIPDALKDWAHEIRSGGNLVAHPSPGDKVNAQDAHELMELAESIFEYLYVVPAEVARRRARLSQP
jgi:hypothetical protein